MTHENNKKRIIDTDTSHQPQTLTHGNSKKGIIDTDTKEENENERSVYGKKDNGVEKKVPTA